MKEKMKTAVMTDIREIAITKRNIPSIAPDEVLVKIEYIGVCGSDLHYFEHGRIGDFVVETPFVLGHEAAGRIVEIGQAVQNLKIGDRVAMEPGKTCGQCEYCKSGKYNLCQKVRFFATPPIDGVFQEYVNHEAKLCFKLPDHVSTMAGALVEPLAVGFHAAKQGGAHEGQTAVVMGAGCIGLVSMLALKAMGVKEVYIVDIVEKRLKKALELGAADSFNSAKENVEKKIEMLTQGKGCDLIIETTGSNIATKQALHMAKKGSTIVLVGYHAQEEFPLPINMILDKELTITSVFRYRNIYPMAIEALAKGSIDIEHIVTHVYDFDDIQCALDESIDNKENVVKAVIKV